MSCIERRLLRLYQRRMRQPRWTGYKAVNVKGKEGKEDHVTTTSKSPSSLLSFVLRIKFSRPATSNSEGVRSKLNVEQSHRFVFINFPTCMILRQSLIIGHQQSVTGFCCQMGS